MLEPYRRHCEGVEAFFNRRVAARQLEQYRRRGPARSTRLLIERSEERRVGKECRL